MASPASCARPTTSTAWPRPGFGCSTDPSLHERIRLAARDAAVRRFSASRVVPMYEAAYERMAMQGAQAPV